MPAATPEDAKLEGFVTDEKVPVSMAHWDAIRRSLARTLLSLEQIEWECTEMLRRVIHEAGCPALNDDEVPCLMSCPEREWRLSALVIRANCRQHVGKLGKVTMPTTADGAWMPPPREFLDRIVAENELLHAKLAGQVSTEPPPLPPVLDPKPPEESSP